MRRLRVGLLAFVLAGALVVSASVAAHLHLGGLEDASCAACALGGHHPAVVAPVTAILAMERTRRAPRPVEAVRHGRPGNAGWDGRAPPTGVVVSRTAVA